jgi:catalase
MNDTITLEAKAPAMPAGNTSAPSGIDEIIALQLEMMKITGPGRRGQHFKHHGCVWAKFEVLADIPERYKVGLFAKPGIYTAYIRFSNGAEMRDEKKDIHGMAIKLTGVPGAKVLEAEASATTHDFILADNPVFFIRDTDEYVVFMRGFAKSLEAAAKAAAAAAAGAPAGPAPVGPPPGGAASAKDPMAEFFGLLAAKYKADIPVVQQFRNHEQNSPLAAQYWSQVPFAFGKEGATICRYSAVPQPGNMMAPPTQRDARYLQQAMIDHLTIAARPAQFDFTVQLRDDATPDMIDNPTVEWDTPVQTVAVITIPPQKFDSPRQMRFCEDLAYTPWHALPEHRPVGQINEIRKAVYIASSKRRHDVNNAPQAEPTGTEHTDFNLRLSREELTANIDDDFKAVVAKLQNTFNFMTAKLQKGRGTHTYGIAAKGEARCIVPPEFPANDTFVFGKVYPIVLRHSSPGGRADDRARDGVAASIKFFEPGGSTNGDGFFDILMNAGRQLFVRSIRGFSTFVHTPDAERVKLVEQGIMLEPQLIEAYRIRGSFPDFRYHTWVCFEFIDSAGVSRFVRFRLINHDRGMDRGLPKPDFRANGRPSMEPEPDDKRDPEFLRKDFRYRVQHSDVRYILQAQLRDAPPAPIGNHELFDPSQPWDEHFHPWRDMFDIRLTEIIDDEEAVSRLEMNPNRSPQCIRIPLATSPDHFASLGHARAIIYPGARAVRASVPPPQNN